MFLLEIEIQESLNKRKWNIISLRAERRAIKVRITNKSYQTNNEEEEKEEEEHKERQEEGEEVIEAEPLLDINHMFDDKNNSVEL